MLNNPLKSTTGIIDELNQVLNDIKKDPDSMKQCDLRLRGCKHAIQVHALSFDYAKYKGSVTPKLKPVELE